MRFLLEIACDNAVFGTTEFERDAEIASILRIVTHDLESDPQPLIKPLRDSNGNVVGQFRFVEP